MAGQTIALTGSGFGRSGGVWFGRRYGQVRSYRPNRILVTVPFGLAEGAGQDAVRVYCGRFSPEVLLPVMPSNQMAIAVEQSPQAIAAVVRVPRAGTVSAVVAGSSAEQLAPRAGLRRLRLPLLPGLRQRLAEGEDLSVELLVRFTPAAGGGGRTVARELKLRGIG